MDCEKYRMWISRKADGELGAKEAGSLESHLASCPECAAFERDLRAMSALFQADRAPSPAASLRDRVLDAARAENLVKSNGIVLALKRLCAAAAVFAAVTVGLFYFGSSNAIHAVDTDQEIHYEDLFQRAGHGDDEVLEVLLKTGNPREALRIHPSTRRP